MLKDRYNSCHVWGIRQCLVPPVGIFIMTLKGGHGLFHVEEKGKCRVAKATGEPKSPQ